ncbi:MAG: T9SS type A sorting domain-containing protein [Flavobacteriales bacterium]|jgi:hypothetical protein|nr:T9SS type A sorting domain-containing protein [Flavobacteriales bacterium]
MKTNLSLILLLLSIAIHNSYAQITPDSLLGVYVGKYYNNHNANSDNWYIVSENWTVPIKDLDTLNCLSNKSITPSGSQPFVFTTPYDFCNSDFEYQENNPDYYRFNRFYGKDSLWGNNEFIPGPPPTGTPYSTRFIGKKMYEIGTTELENMLAIQVYPNPAKELLNIRTEEDIQAVDIHIFNSRGQRVKTFIEKYHKNWLQVDVLDLPKGIYYIKITSFGRVFHQKFIKI